MIIEWVNRITWFPYLLMGTSSYVDNVERNLLWASIFSTVLVNRQIIQISNESHQVLPF